MQAAIDKTNIVVVDGDITTQKVDVMVNSANTWMSLGGRRSVAGTILIKTHGKIQDELNGSKVPVDIGGIAITKGYGLPCKYIFHLATHGTQEEERAISQDDMVVRLYVIAKGIEKIIKKANELGVESLAMPIFATGSLGYPKMIIAEAILNSLENNLDKNSTLREVRIVVHKDKDTFDRLANAVRYKLIEPAKNALPSSDITTAEAWSSTLGRSLHKQSDSKYNFFFVRPSLVRKHSYATDEGSPGDYVTIPAITLKTLEEDIFNLREQVRILREERSRVHSSESATVHLPLPIAFAVSMAEAEHGRALRAENMRKAFSIFLRYLAILGIAEYYAAGAFSKELNAKIIDIFKKPLTDGAWLKIIEEISQAFSNGPEATVIKEYPGLFIKNNNKSHLGGLLRGLLEMRNKIHDSFIVDETTCKKWLEKVEPMWKSAISDAKPLFDYELFFLEDLIDFSEKDLSTNIYQVRWLMGEFFVPRGEIVEWRSRLRKGRLYLKAPGSELFLQLDPFMIYEHCKITNARETSCIEKIMEESVSFATFRFPYQWQVSSCPTEIKKFFEVNNFKDNASDN